MPSSVLTRALPFAAALAALSANAPAQSWMPNEAQVSAEAELIDYEFSQSRAQIAWNDTLGKLWVANVDRATGKFVPADGRGVVVDPDSMSFQDAQKTKNGPEWVQTAAGDILVHTKYAGRHTDGNSRIGVAVPGPNGSWTSSILSDAVRKAPYGSNVVGDTAARISYVDNREVHYWAQLGDPSTERRIEDFPDSNYPVRHVACARPDIPGTHAVVYPVTVNGVDQVFYRDFDGNRSQQLTFDAGVKYEVWMWCAPEYGYEPVFFTLVDQTELRVYRKIAGSWTPVFSQTAPKGNQIFSPEPFTWNGKSYIFMAQSVKPNKFRSEIWIANIDATAPLFKRITPTEPLRTRTDPEVFITDAGPRIYYNKLIPDVSDSGRYKPCRKPSCSEGVWNADPGL
ncbi:hypothetical protein [Rubrivivax gelatinosus]|uniref:WD40 repeat protein n=1 Tax=Rubrivivax gelatinosus (strain NBRC 100245 / IL144) TaxID=983917 RepID=I0HTW8_RUBGI|nr:hypothetical protein [Rubrivivax gelatinosus]BAL96455.1 hypothetical protein RGE_31160 [Rubrivivax gelatinosus IL144]